MIMNRMGAENTALGLSILDKEGRRKDSVESHILATRVEEVIQEWSWP